MDQSADNGFATYKVIHTYLTEKKMTSKSTDIKVKSEPGDGETVEKLGGTKTETFVDVKT